MKRILICGICLLPVLCRAQPGISEMQRAKQDLTASFFSTFDFAMATAGLLGLAGAVRIFYNLQMGHERIVDQLSAWFFAAMFIILAGAFLRALFGL